MTTREKPATGTFDVNLTPQDDGDHPAGRMLIAKTYHGDMRGNGMGQMISKRTESGTAAYFAVEEFAGSIHGKSGTLTLLHKGFMSTEKSLLEIDILEGSGTGEFEGIRGSLVIDQADGIHSYVLTFNF